MKTIGHHVRLVRICPIITIDYIAIVVWDSPPYTSDRKQNGGLWVVNLKSSLRKFSTSIDHDEEVFMGNMP